MARRQLDARLGDQVDERMVRRRRGGAHRRHHALIGLRAGDRRDVGVGVADLLGLGAHAAGDDHLAVLGHRRADRVERLLLGAVEEAAGVDDHRVGAGVALRKFVALGAQPGEDALAVDQRLGAAERNERDARRRLGRIGGGVGHGGPIATGGAAGKARLARPVRGRRPKIRRSWARRSGGDTATGDAMRPPLFAAALGSRPVGARFGAGDAAHRGARRHRARRARPREPRREDRATATRRRCGCRATRRSRASSPPASPTSSRASTSASPPCRARTGR